jgi:hypothetical protein
MKTDADHQSDWSPRVLWCEEGKCGGSVQMLTILAVSPESAQALYSALSAFDPDMTTDDEDRCFISFKLSGSRATGVLDALQAYARSSGGDEPLSSMTVSLDEPTMQ